MPVHVGRFATSAAAATLAATLLGVSPGAVWAHGAGADQLTTLSALTSWTLEPLALLGILAAAAVYLAAVRRVDRVHRLNPVPRRRTAAWLAGLLVVAVALFSFLDVYAGQLFSVHMVQHILLTMVAAPLLVLGAPVTLLLRALPRGWRPRRAVPRPGSPPRRLPAEPAGGRGFFPLQPPLRRRPRGRRRARPRARALPVGRGHVLVAGRRGRPEPAPDGVRHALRVRAAEHAPELVPRPGHLLRAGRPVRPPRDPDARLGPHAAGGAAPRRRHHVGGGRHAVPRAAALPDRGLAPRRGGEGPPPRRTAGPRTPRAPPGPGP